MDIPSRMKAIRKTKPEGGPAATELVEVAVPEPKTGEALIKVLSTALCGTDRHIYNWDASIHALVSPPRIYGHEFCGELVQLGPGCDNPEFSVGAYVSAEMHAAARGTNLCDPGKNCPIVELAIGATSGQRSRVDTFAQRSVFKR